jgi:hypothetical protein
MINNKTDKDNFQANVNVDSARDALEVPRLVRFLRFFGFRRSNNKRILEIIYKPEEDITVWELAQIVPCFTERHFGSLQSFPDSVLRHFEIEGNKLSVERIQELTKEGRLRI